MPNRHVYSADRPSNAGYQQWPCRWELILTSPICVHEYLVVKISIPYHLRSDETAYTICTNDNVPSIRIPIIAVNRNGFFGMVHIYNTAVENDLRFIIYAFAQDAKYNLPLKKDGLIPEPKLVSKTSTTA